jgi:hypothetical protein
MTTLAEARDEIHELAARRMSSHAPSGGRLRQNPGLQIGMMDGIRLERWAPSPAWAASVGICVCDFPIRHSAILAGSFTHYATARRRRLCSAVSCARQCYESSCRRASGQAMAEAATDTLRLISGPALAY